MDVAVEPVAAGLAAGCDDSPLVCRLIFNQQRPTWHANVVVEAKIDRQEQSLLFDCWQNSCAKLVVVYATLYWCVDVIE